MKAIDDSINFIALQYDRAWQMLSPYLVLSQPMKLEELVDAPRQPPPEYMSLVPKETLCASHELLLGLSPLTDFYGSSVYNYEAWQGALTTACELAEAETG